MHKPLDSATRSMGPSSIALPPPPVFSSFTLQGCTPDKSPGTPLEAGLQFHTAPSSPATPLEHWYTPPSTPGDEPVPAENRPSAPQSVEILPPSAVGTPIHAPHVPSPDTLPPNATFPSAQSATDDAFPNNISDLAVDLVIGEEGLTTLEKIYLYCRSDSLVHRVFIAHQLPSFLDQVAPQEAIEYVLPLIEGLAVDDEESVKEALAAELVPVIWWFFSHCQVIPDDPDAMEGFASTSTTATISVQVFTPILATLLLSSNPLIVGSARFAVVDLLTRMSRADDRESGVSSTTISPSTDVDDDDDEESDTAYAVGLFKHDEREMFRQEILHSVVIGMGKLGDAEDAMGPEQNWTESPMRQVQSLESSNAQGPPATSTRSHSPSVSTRPQSPAVNPYFPSTTHTSTGEGSSRPFSERSASPASASPPLVPPFTRGAHSQTQTTLSPGFPSPGPRTPESDQRTSLAAFDVDQHHRNAEQSDETDDEQAAIGQLSSMSLMAAVTATVFRPGFVTEDIQRAFVQEVERVGRDSAYFYVRREASLALGALAKVVPEDLVLNSLVPLFDKLRWDSDWRVRHSALFALPAILPRLSLNHKRTLALETVQALSKDPYGGVRSSVLESLGEVLYSFHNDPGGPPAELVHMFLGREQDKNVRKGNPSPTSFTWMANYRQETAAESFYTDPERPLICAFNFPAVTLTLGPDRWRELREAYVDLSENTSPKVRKTLTASLGEMAKIIGKGPAKQDLVPIWWKSVRAQEEEIRTKAIETLDTLLQVLQEDDRLSMLREILSVWQGGILRGWREREMVLSLLDRFLVLGGSKACETIEGLLVKGLHDTVAAVRELAIHLLPRIWNALASNNYQVQQLQQELDSLATDSAYKRRISFVACLQSCLLYIYDGQKITGLTLDKSLKYVERLAGDPVVDVRIGLARLLKIVYGEWYISTHRAVYPPPPEFAALHLRLAADISREVRSFLPDLHQTSAEVGVANVTTFTPSHASRKHYPHPSTFSRPPPPNQTQIGHDVQLEHSTSV
ncbi:HEAT repeat family protein [Coprinopsis sp. MPI-PUGE-AT-0042]|nr:HEAT repeat family protein [Coprinopsis sp. MPI-PUGE-AT-0042]